MNRLLYLENCVSTQDEIINLINEDETTAVFTFNQTKGRGQYGNEWRMLTHQNLAYSVAVKAGNFNISHTSLNYYTAVIIRDFLANMAHADVKIKWPNDIIINGKKVCGFIIEKQKVKDTDYLIIGIGINILQTDFSQLPKAGSVFSTTGKSYDLVEFTEKFHNYLSTEISKTPSEDIILTRYNSLLFRKDEIAVFSKDNIRQNGIILNADAEGFLWIDLEKDGVKKFVHKEIEMLY
ncbi:MAG TPA: biotin--[acetyl-CoA-carboxylase] ligase [Chryseobacterium sp.]|nr:biotin--[acetyl-CoA-carboxylase] ligase [Chryseobacterium sp.]